MDTPTTAEAIRTLGESVTELADALAHAEEVQWLQPAGPSTRQETPEKGKGGISNPTADTTADARRLRVRAAVITAELEVANIHSRAVTAAKELRAAVTDWAGVRA
ncbi:hypothetical protein J2Y69_003381 [Microbacterium resistens]|uniref:Uncharacterized protein n=1 Tax=Microbacterium resistens TaxID=156977 RepID=A0ABU1SGS9_9MICO|nr:hypothetical protein [Microbacterium resistens]MDR6868757.1 hypothetical protein [Microbacterium resistens]